MSSLGFIVDTRDKQKKDSVSQVITGSIRRKQIVHNESKNAIKSRDSANQLALVIGINYNGTRDQLRGCINDGNNIISLLKSKAGFTDSQIIFMNDNLPSSSPLFPTRQKILAQMALVVNRARNESIDNVWVSYSGHGSRVRDTNREEKDGFDETICPVDYASAGMITDDTLYSTLISPMPKQTRIVSLFDSCRSGTVLDLPYTLNSSSIDFTNTLSTSFNTRVNALCNVLMLSGCRDDQLSYETWYNSAAAGALTANVCQILTNSPDLKCIDLLLAIRRNLEVVQQPLISSSTLSQLEQKFLF